MTCATEQLLRSVHEKAREGIERGKLADYIPALARADKRWAGLALRDLSGRRFAVGDSRIPFSLQSASKPFTLLAALERRGHAEVFKHVGYEPSGDPFYSLVQLEHEHGRPRNPFINAGAIAVASLLPGDTPEEKCRCVQELIEAATGKPVVVDEEVCRSESETGFRNRAIAYFMRNFGVIDGDPVVAVEAYFRACSMLTTAEELADLGVLLAGLGRHPTTGCVVDAEHVRICLSLMTTCGLYDGSGGWLVKVGLPAKSGVSGGIVAVGPWRGAIATFGPAIDHQGTSIFGEQALTVLAHALDWGVFDPLHLLEPLEAAPGAAAR